MKPSKFLLNKEKQIYIDMSISTTKNIINKLDKRFIDKVELKDKINKIDIWHKNGLQLKKEILELLK